MKRFVPWIVAVAVTASCAHNTNLRKPSAQDNFGVQMARDNLWREAMFRFQRAIEIDPNDARAHNNLAVAYEANGDFEKARKEYLEALKLDRTNQYIQKNYSRFVEFLSRNRKRQQAVTASGTGAPQVPGSATPVAAEAAKPATSPAAAPPVEAAPAAAVPAPAAAASTPAPPPATSTQPPTPPPPGGAL